MRGVDTIFPCLALCCLLLAGGSSRAQANGTGACNVNLPQAERNICEDHLEEQADVELNKLYQEQMRYQQDEGSKEALKKAQQEWIKYRDSACLYEAGSDSGGTIHPMLVAQCTTQYTKERIKHMKEYVSCRQDGCPN